MAAPTPSMAMYKENWVLVNPRKPWGLPGVCRGNEGENAASLIVGMMQSPPHMTLAMAWLSSCACPRTRPAEDMIEGPREISSWRAQPTGVSEENLAQASGVLLQVEVQVRGIRQGAVTLPKDWKAAPPLVMIRGLHVDPVTNQRVG